MFTFTLYSMDSHSLSGILVTKSGENKEISAEIKGNALDNSILKISFNQKMYNITIFKDSFQLEMTRILLDICNQIY